MRWYLEVIGKYVAFSGRARRKEYWMFALFNALATFLLLIIDAVIGTYNEDTGYGLISTIYALGVFLPALSVNVRRLHDTNRPGWWLLAVFVPIVGWIALPVFLTQDSTPGANAYGPNPKEA